MTTTATAAKTRAKSAGLEHEVYLALVRLANDLNGDIVELLKAHGLTGPQFNVLRILRGAGGDGLACGEIAERLIAKDPDITRLLDRLAKQGLVARARAESDRRVVRTRIAPDGLALLARLDAPVAALHRRQLGGLGPERLSRLLELLGAAAAARPAR